ncbi:hypothetical protein B0T26DRAFT_675174 [Lasiosphaeria miniovina]|uniref:Uncharacterized protein n=1 Tax=Lasiosphaeria miniovina TaxID=1954250 RepID=A0AA40AJ14_9PEZI|nr:uncharacterized protein B0T26DRAFT_675174 [Lasiosphaeria miniovina]KAK0716741.1 hypothetical protein B0T26DRAFT_675174 [Lasiosphaeria miniovina]
MNDFQDQGMGILSVTIRYNARDDKVVGYIVADLGAFDHTALYGITSEAESFQNHPLLIPVLALERALEVLCCDLEFYCIHTVRENVPLDREYSKKVPKFLAWELELQHEWLPSSPTQQYSMASTLLITRVKRALAFIEQFTRFADDITGRMSAWQAGAFHKVAQEDSDFNKELMSQGKRDSSTMKFLAFLGTIFLPLTFVSSFFSMPVFDWRTSTADGFVGSRFWLWWATVLPLTAATVLLMYLWIRLKLGNQGKEHVYV